MSGSRAVVREEWRRRRWGACAGPAIVAVRSGAGKTRDAAGAAIPVFTEVCGSPTNDVLVSAAMARVFDAPQAIIDSMDTGIEKAGTDIFWGEVAPCEHLVQFYKDEGRFMDTLADFIDAGLRNGEATIVIATAAHRSSLEARLREAGHDLAMLRNNGAYTALDAASTLASFMVGGWPDEARFRAVIHALVDAARREGRNVRAFGEMVVLLWEQGHHGATVRLEHLWNALCEDSGLALFCAYPRIGATRDLTESLTEVCAAHSRVVFA